MIETNFDNCVGPLHSVCRTKFSSWDREKALPIDQSQSKEISSVCQYQKRFIYRLLARHGFQPVWLVADK